MMGWCLFVPFSFFGRAHPVRAVDVATSLVSHVVFSGTSAEFPFHRLISTHGDRRA